MNPYNPDYDAMIDRTEHQKEKQFTPEQLAKTWFARIKECALEIEIENDIPFYVNNHG